jgi:hypothetical protein
MNEEPIGEQLRRAHDLIDEAASIVEDVRDTLGLPPTIWLEYAYRHLREARRVLSEATTPAAPDYVGEAE